MLESTATEVALIGVRLIDDAYMVWHGAESEADAMLQGWFRAAGEWREPAYLAYLAALDREEASARDLERLWRLASPCRDALVEPTEDVSE
jgi:hypothetical protein